MAMNFKIIFEGDSMDELREAVETGAEYIRESPSDALSEIPGRTYEERLVYKALAGQPGATLQRIHEAASSIDGEFYSNAGGDFNEERHRVRRTLQNLEGSDLAENDYKNWYAVDPDSGERID